LKKLLLMISALVLTGCLGMPNYVEPVKDFKLDRYLGKWYEIARLDHSFERGLTQVSAEYSLKPEEAEGKAYFVNGENEAYLKVSFFGPFYGSYVVFGLDQQNYQYAFISGPDTDYLWLLARTPTVSPEVIKQFVDMAKARGFDTDSLIYVEQQAEAKQ